MVRIYAPSSGFMYSFPEQNWNLIRLFDGKSTYEEIAAQYSAQSGNQYSAEAVREFAGELEAADFWYKTTQEKNILPHDEPPYSMIDRRVIVIALIDRELQKMLRRSGDGRVIQADPAGCFHRHPPSLLKYDSFPE